MPTPRAPLRMTTIRLTGLDYALLAEVQKREGVQTGSGAIRYLLRRYAKAEGLDLDSLTPPPSAVEESAPKPARKTMAKAGPKASSKPKRRAARG